MVINFLTFPFMPFNSFVEEWGKALIDRYF